MRHYHHNLFSTYFQSHFLSISFIYPLPPSTNPLFHPLDLHLSTSPIYLPSVSSSLPLFIHFPHLPTLRFNLSTPIYPLPPSTHLPFHPLYLHLSTSPIYLPSVSSFLSSFSTQNSSQKLNSRQITTTNHNICSCKPIKLPML